MTDTPTSLRDDEEIVVLEQQFNITNLSADLAAQGISLIIRHHASGEQASTSADGGKKSKIQQLTDENRRLKRSLEEATGTLTMQQQEFKSMDEKMRTKIQRLESDKEELDMTLTTIKRENTERSNLIEKIWDAIRCPVCALVRNRVVQCENGHHVCIHCQREMPRCPVCRVSYNAGAHKNLVAEEVANLCPYQISSHTT